MSESANATDGFEYIACWGDISDADRAALSVFWQAEGALNGAERVAARLPQVVMYARSATGDIAGVCTADRVTAPRLGQPVYYWRTFTAHAWRAKLPVKALLLRSCELLEEHARAHKFPAIGVLLELENSIFKGKARNAARRNPRFVYIGQSMRGLEVRVHYFRGARLKQDGSSPAAPAPTGKPVTPTPASRDFTYVDCWQQISESDAQAVIAFWRSEDAMDDDQDPQERCKEIVIFARDAAGDVAAAATAVPMTLARLGQPVYYYRAFVGRKYRNNHLILSVVNHSRALLQTYAQAHNYPSIGILLELENDRFARAARRASWSHPRFDYIGKSPRGLDLRTDYFDGAQLKFTPTKAERSA